MESKNRALGQLDEEVSGEILAAVKDDPLLPGRISFFISEAAAEIDDVMLYKNSQ